MAKFWPFLALVWSEVVENGIKSFVFYRESIPFYEFWLENPEPGDDPDGQVWAISGPHGVRGDRK